jgi:hypothetical protein
MGKKNDPRIYKNGIPVRVKISIFRSPMRFYTLQGAVWSMLPQCYFVATLFNVPVEKYPQLRRNLSGDACHHGCITKFIKERLVVSSVQVRGFGPSNTGYSQLTTIMPSMDGFIRPVKTW